MATAKPNKVLAARLAALKASTEPVRKQFITSAEKGAVDAEARTVRFTITTGAVDRDNDTISPKGWDVSEYLRNPAILWAHDYSQLPVARALDVVPTATGLDSTAQFPPKGVHPFADTVFELIAGGFLNASSVGFKPLEFERADDRDGINFQRQSLLEWSIVPVPANAEALVVARSKGVDLAPLERWAEGVLKATGRARAKPVPAALKQAQFELRRKDVGAGATTLLVALDDSLDTANDLMDAVLVTLGIADDAEDAAPAAPASAGPWTASCPECGMKFNGEHCASCGYTARAAGKEVPPMGQGTGQLCPACGSSYTGNICLACGWVAPAANPGDPQGPTGGGAPQGAPPIGVPNTPAYNSSVDTLRWNRKLSKAFDVAGEPLEPSRLEYAWVSRYIGAPLQDISVETFEVPSARMGSFLAAYDEALGAWTVDALRAMNYDGREVPPEHETIQLSSTVSRSFLVAGLRFMKRPADGVKIVEKVARNWYGLDVTHYIRHDQAEVRDAWVRRVRGRATELNYLRGEAFTLSGEFLDRGALDWPDLFLEPKVEATLRRTVDRINEQGEDLESRGLMVMGPPGTGKTLSGRVMMRQADTTFIWISARDFYRSGAFGAFTYAFDLAAECAPSILFFEDVDNWLTGMDTIDLLKTEMDGLKRRKGILTVLTTNFPELLPEALIDRPGRFHDLLEMGLPTEAVRARMLEAWLPEAPERTRAATAKLTDGYSGAHVRELVNFAGTIRREQGVGLDEALPLALEKIREQRALVASLHEAPDYRPRRAVRTLVGRTIEKRGRVLSAANEGRLRTAQDHMATAGTHLDAVLGQLATQPAATTDGGDETAAFELADDAGEALALADDDELGGDDLRAALRGALQETVGALIRDETHLALARARGRVD